MDIAILLFDRVTALDAIGPYEVLSRLPGASITFCSATPGEVRSDNRFLGLTADRSIAEVASADVLVVPGGPGTRSLMSDSELHDWIRRIHETTTWTTSVCTGSLLLGSAGLLDGLPATGHWIADELLETTGARPTRERVVVLPEARIITAAGVSSGIDMALRLAALLHGDDVAQAIQLSIEYDPQPPFDAGSPEKAPAAVVDRLRALAARGSG